MTKTGLYTLLALLLAGLLWSLLQREEAHSSAAQPSATSAAHDEPRGGLPDTRALPSATRETARVALDEQQVETPVNGSSPLPGNVRVTLVDATSGDPLPDVRVWIDPQRPQAEEPEAQREVYRWMEAQGWGTLAQGPGWPRLMWGAEMPRTDEQGVCLLPWPAGVAFRLLAGDPEHDMAWVRRAEDALSPGEQRTLTLEVSIGADYTFHGRVLSAGAGAPIAEAEVYALSDEWRAEPTLPLAPADARRDSEYLELLARSDADGRFTLGGRSWKQRALLEDERVLLVATGFGPTIAGMTRAHATSEEELVIRLEAAGEVQGYVTGSPGSGAVELRCGSGSINTGGQMAAAERLVWSVPWHEDGSFRLGDLPPNVALEVRLHPSSGEVRLPSAPITLDAGESRVVEWALGGTTLLRGVVLDEHDDVVVGVPVAAIALEGPPPESVAGVIQMFGAPADFAARARTDARGSFELTGLGAGLWAVGVVIIEYPPDLEVSATGTLIEIPPGVAELEVLVPVFRDLSIRGVVRAPDDEPLGEVHVSASGLVGSGFADCQIDDEGRFELGPLAPGVYRVSAWAPDRLIYFSALELEAGARDVVLQGHLAGGLRGRIFQVDGTPAPRVRVRLTLPGTLDCLPLRSPDGHFVLSPLRPGGYDLIVSSPKMDALALFVQVVAGRETELPDLYLEAAGQLSLKAGEGSSMTRATLKSAGSTYPVDLWPGLTAVLSLPPGDYELELPPSGAASGGSAHGRTLEFVVRAGEEQQLVVPE